jgi:hypothetical protein
VREKGWKVRWATKHAEQSYTGNCAPIAMMKAITLCKVLQENPSVVRNRALWDTPIYEWAAVLVWRTMKKYNGGGIQVFTI